MERTAGGITYTLTRRRVRNINLRVRADGSVAASASPRVPAVYVDAFVTARADWVRTAQALTLRIGLSILIFALLLIGFRLGWIPGYNQ